MPLSLFHLKRVSYLGWAVRSVWRRRTAQVGEELTAAGLAAFGRPLLEAVGQVLQRYINRLDLETGRGAMGMLTNVTIDKSGTIKMADADFLDTPLPEPHALVCLMEGHQKKDRYAGQDLHLYLIEPDGTRWGAQLELPGPNARTPASLRNERAFLGVFNPNCELMGAMFIIAGQGGEGSTRQEAPPQQASQAHPVAPPSSGAGHHVQPDEGASGEAYPGTSSTTARPVLQQRPRRLANKALKKVLVGFNVQDSWELVDQGIVMVMELAVGFKIPCCQANVGGGLWASGCENKRFCGEHRDQPTSSSGV
jgi:hypothetical protein